jgi:hypothetical protein
MVRPDSPVDVRIPSGETLGGTFAAINPKGFTLPSLGTKTGNEPGFSPVTGLTQIFINATLSPQQQAPVVAVELGAHALPALLGRGSRYPSQAEHKAAETPLKAAAIENASQ